MAKFHVRSAYIYLTERCTLRCGYCYFRDKRARDLSREVVGRFLEFLESQASGPASFVISGGEPLLCWKEFQWLVLALRQRFPGRPVHLQTNGTLLTPVRIAFIRRTGLRVEFGVDGDEGVTVRRRCGLGAAGFAALVRNIRLCAAAGISCGCTMTVHPDEAGDILRRAVFLRSLGVSSIDVTPAAFMPWTAAAAARFRRSYAAVLADAALRKLVLTSEDRELVGPGVMDLSLHPPGYLLAGDAFLCLPEKQRARASFWDMRTGALKPGPVLRYQRANAELHRRRKRVTYRELVCCHFKLVNVIMGREYINTAEMIPLMNFLTKAHLQMMLKGKK